MVVAAIAALSVPALSGCSAQVGYILKTDENGDKYYSVAAEGNALFLKGEVVIPETHGGYPVKEIAPHGFSGTAITKITVPATIEKIGDAAFSYNNNLKEAVFADGGVLEEIPWWAFAYCPNLKTVTMSSSVKTVEGAAFYECIRLEEINFSEGLERINVAAFSECTALVSVNLPEGLISIGNSAFFGCTSLESIILPDGMHDTEELSLDSEGKPVTEKIPAVGAIAFFGCNSLKTAYLGEGITTVSEGLFGNCVALERLYLPSTLKQIKGMYESNGLSYGHAFYNVKNLSVVYFGGSQDDWEQVEIDDTEYKGNNVSDNSAILNSTIIYNFSFSGLQNF